MLARLAKPNVARDWEWCEFRENEQLLNNELFQNVKAKLVSRLVLCRVSAMSGGRYQVLFMIL